MAIPKTKADLLTQFWSILSCLPKKSEYLDKCVASENKRVRYSILQQLLSKNYVVLPQ